MLENKGFNQHDLMLKKPDSVQSSQETVTIGNDEYDVLRFSVYYKK